MEKSLWLDGEQTLQKLLETEQYSEMLDYSDDNRFILFSAYSDDKPDSLRKCLRLGSAILQRFSRYLQHQSEQLFAVFRIGALCGHVECLNRILYEKDRQLASKARHGREILYIKHVPQILNLLYKEGTLTHSELCDELVLKASTLTEIMKKIAPEELIDHVTSGKYKLYSLTDEGRLYAKQLQKDTQHEFGLEGIERQLARYIDQSNDPEKIKWQLADQLLHLNEDNMVLLRPGDNIRLTQNKRPFPVTSRYEVVNAINDENDALVRKHIIVRPKMLEEISVNSSMPKGA